MGIVGRLDQYASMLAGEFDDYSMSENLMTNSQLGTTILNDGGAVTLTTDISIINPFGGYDGVLKCVHTTNTLGYFRRGQALSLTAGTTYTFSVFFKNGTVINPYGQNNISPGPNVAANTFSPSFEEFVASLKTTIPFQNGWYRQVITFTPTYNQTYNVFFNHSVNQTPIGTYYLYGFQLENGSVATDYTPTTTTAKTRVLSSTTNTSITGLSTYFSSGFSENVGAATTLVANVFPPYDLVYDDFGGTLFGAGQGRYMRQNTDKSVIVYNEIDEVSDFYSRGIVKAGLVLDLDAGIDSSYAGTGITWTDLSVYGNNGTLTNGPTFSSSNGGVIVFDGTNDYISFSSLTTSSLGLTSSNGATLSCWINIALLSRWTGVFTFWPIAGSVDFGWDIDLTNVLRIWKNGSAVLTSSLSSYSNTWANYVLVSNSSSNRFYINSTLFASSLTQTGNITSTTGTLWFGDHWDNPIQGNASTIQIYNRALTAAEIKQNYDATKGRFGL